MKLCKDCKHHDGLKGCKKATISIDFTYGHNKNWNCNFVRATNGWFSRLLQRLCWEINFQCGQEGKYWEAKDAQEG